MTDLEAIAEFRLCVGDLSPNVLSPETIRRFYVRALERLASELQWNIPPATTITVAADVYQVPLPDDLLWLLWVEANGLRLTPSEVNRWIRDSQNWQTTPSGTPSLFAVQARQLLFNPPPGSETQFTFSYIANSPGLQSAGVTGLPDQDFRVAIRDAAMEWLAMNSGENDAEMKRRTALLSANTAFYQRELELAKDRRFNTALYAQSRIQVGGRISFPPR